MSKLPLVFWLNEIVWFIIIVQMPVIAVHGLEPQEWGTETRGALMREGQQMAREIIMQI